MTMPVTKHLVLHSYRSSDLEFDRLARLVEEYAPDVKAFVVRDRRIPFRVLRFARRPTLLFSPTPLKRLRLLRGTVCQGKRLSKAEELATLDAAGVPVPPWFLLDSDRDVGTEARALGKFVVLKPNVGNRGEQVRITRAGRVRWKPEYAERDGVIVQQFVYTGRWPVNYRVTTLFGEVLFCARAEVTQTRAPLDNREDWHGRKSIVASAQNSTWTLVEDEEMMNIARDAARAFPDIPLLGVDLVRDIETGKCRLLKGVNTMPGGEVNGMSVDDFVPTFQLTKIEGLSLKWNKGYLAKSTM